MFVLCKALDSTQQEFQKSEGKLWTAEYAEMYNTIGITNV